MRSVIVFKMKEGMEPFALEALIEGIVEYVRYRDLEATYELMDSSLSNVVTDSIDELSDKMMEPTRPLLSVYDKEKHQHYLNEKRDEQFIRFVQLRIKTLKAFQEFRENFNDTLESMGACYQKVTPTIKAERDKILFISIESKPHANKTGESSYRVQDKE